MQKKLAKKKLKQIHISYTQIFIQNACFTVTSKIRMYWGIKELDADHYTKARVCCQYDDSIAFRWIFVLLDASEMKITLIRELLLLFTYWLQINVALFF